jgi:DNA polymerase-1
VEEKVRTGGEGGLFSFGPTALPGDTDPLEALELVYADQQRRIALSPQPHRTRMLLAAESASALVAAEMNHYGLPWSVDVHGSILTEMFGPKPSGGMRPVVLTEKAARLREMLDDPELNPDSPASIKKAFRRLGFDISTSRAWVLKSIDHPAIPLLLEYKELSHLYSTHGWNWLEKWVVNGRFQPEFVVGGVISGRWASNGGGALQLPKSMRKAAIAEPGHKLVVADGAQLEPRILAALSNDVGLAEMSVDVDMYTNLADEAFKGDRGQAKIGMLSAMYGSSSADARALLAIMHSRFPDAINYVDAAAAAGEQGRIVHTVLGRTSPSSASYIGAEFGDESLAQEQKAISRARSWGRFTRNFVVQGSAADWAAVFLASLRRELHARLPAAEMVFFLHDEVIVHCVEDDAAAVVAEIDRAALEATRIIFPGTKVLFPMVSNIVDCYADAK